MISKYYPFLNLTKTKIMTNKLTLPQNKLIEEMKIYTAEKNKTFGWYTWRGRNGHIPTTTMNSLIRQYYVVLNEDNTLSLTDKAKEL